MQLSIATAHEQGMQAGLFAYPFQVVLETAALQCSNSDEFVRFWEVYENAYADGTAVRELISGKVSA